MPTLVRITTQPLSLKNLLAGQMRFMSQNGFDVTMVSSDGVLKQELILQENCTHIVVPMTRTISPIADLVSLFRLIILLKKLRPDIVHTHTPKAGLLGMLASKICRVPHRIHTLAGLPLMTATGLKKKLLIITEKLTYWAAHEVWPNSLSLKKYVIENKLCKSDKLDVIKKGSSNGINLEKYNFKNISEEEILKIKNDLGVSTDSYWLLFVGRIVKDKGIIELVEIFDELKLQKANVRLMLVGSFEEALDPLPAEILEKIKTDPDIVITEWVSNVVPYYHFADLVVFPSHREGFPNALLQAGAFNKPVVCSDISGNIDLINAETGFLYKVGEKQDLLNKILFVFQNAEEAKRRSNNLYKEVVTNYDNKIIMQEILSRYNKMMAQ